MIKLHKAFTLFEILLAMLLMAFIAITILPSITKNAEKQLFVTQLKKVQNDLQQAMLIISSRNRNDISKVFSNPIYKTSNGYPTTDAPNSGSEIERNFVFAYAIRSVLQANCIYYANDTRESGNAITDPKKQAQLFANRFPHYMTKDVLYTEQKDYNKDMNYPHPKNFAAMNLKNGATVRPVMNFDTANLNTPICNQKQEDISNICGYLEVDLNGTKNPNVVGKDIHRFWVVNTDDGIVPWGQDDGKKCELNNKGKFANKEASDGCTYRALLDGKMNYY